MLRGLAVPGRLVLFSLVASIVVVCGDRGTTQSSGPAAAPAVQEDLARRATIRRDTYGVPHILAETEEAAAFAHGYATAEDHLQVMARLFLRARGAQASVFGDQFVEDDLRVRQLGIWETADRRFAELPPLMQRILNGYASGYNAYLGRHRAEAPAWATPVSGIDVLAHCRAVLLMSFALDLRSWKRTPNPVSTSAAAIGSNMWAIGKPLSRSGRGILLANPHLPWQGAFLFHEAHLTVPGAINVSGATPVGFPVITIGFNEQLGWSHTVNERDSDDIYELTLDADGAATYQYDDGWLPLGSRRVAIDVKTKGGVETRTYDVLSSHHGPVFRVEGRKAYAFKSASVDLIGFLTEYNAMGKARSLREFQAALNMQQLPMFNLAYADREGNVWFLYNARIPIRPEGYDWAGVVPGNTSRTEWHAVYPLAELPQLFNPLTGYVQNCNDAPWYANLRQPIDPSPFRGYIDVDNVTWRARLSLGLLSSQNAITLADVKRHKFNREIVVATHVKPELIAAAQARAVGEALLQSAVQVLARWDNRADVDSEGAILFLAWWADYSRGMPAPFRSAANRADPVGTPTGLGDTVRAVEALARAAAAIKKQYGVLNVPWGKVHRLRRGSVDLPLAGSEYAFQTVAYRADYDGARAAAGGDSFVLAVEFTDPPTAFSITSYSESSNPQSVHYNDQSWLYAAGQFKPAWFAEPDIAANVVRSYRPGQ